MIEVSMVAISTPRVVLESATHLYRSPGALSATAAARLFSAAPGDPFGSVVLPPPARPGLRTSR